MNKIKKVVLRENLVALTGDPIAAIILNQMLYWSERTRDCDKFILEEQAHSGNEMSEMLMHGWIYKSSEELTEELMGIASMSTIRRRLINLVKNGWIDERNNPKYAWDRTLQYRPNIHKIQRDLMKIGYVLDDYPLQLDVVGESIIHSDESNLHSDESNLRGDEALPEITTENTTDIQADSISENPPSELDAFFGAPEPSDVDLPEKINLHDQAERERYALRLQEQRKARVEGEPWLTQYEWIKPRSGIERNTLRKVAHTLIEAGIPEPESDAVKNKWKPALEAVYIESGGDFGLIKRAGEAMVAGGLQFWPTHKWVDQVIALKAEKTQGKTSTFKPRSVHDDDESWESPAQDLTIPY